MYPANRSPSPDPIIPPDSISSVTITIERRGRTLNSKYHSNCCRKSRSHSRHRGDRDVELQCSYTTAPPPDSISSVNEIERGRALQRVYVILPESRRRSSQSSSEGGGRQNSPNSTGLPALHGFVNDEMEGSQEGHVEMRYVNLFVCAIEDDDVRDDEGDDPSSTEHDLSFEW